MGDDVGGTPAPRPAHPQQAPEAAVKQEEQQEEEEEDESPRKRQRTEVSGGEGAQGQGPAILPQANVDGAQQPQQGALPAGASLSLTPRFTASAAVALNRRQQQQQAQQQAQQEALEDPLADVPILANIFIRTAPASAAAAAYAGPLMGGVGWELSAPSSAPAQAAAAAGPGALLWDAPAAAAPKRPLHPVSLPEPLLEAHQWTQASDLSEGGSLDSLEDSRETDLQPQSSGGSQCSGGSTAPAPAQRRPVKAGPLASSFNICANCLATSTPLWRRDKVTGTILVSIHSPRCCCLLLLQPLVSVPNLWSVLQCNACGIYFKVHGRSRPVDGPAAAKAAAVAAAAGSAPAAPFVALPVDLGSALDGATGFSVSRDG